MIFFKFIDNKILAKCKSLWYFEVMRKKLLPLLIWTMISYFLSFPLSYSQETTSLTTKITFLVGTVEVQKKGETTWKKAKIDLILSKHDKIKTWKDSLVEILLSNFSVVRLGELTTVEISKLQDNLQDNKEKENLLNILFGDIWIKTLKLIDRDARIKIMSPIAVAGIRGTVLSAKVMEDSSTSVNVYQGEVRVNNLPPKKETKIEKKEGLYEIAKTYEETAKPYHEVSCQEWCEIVKEMERITISPDGSYKKSQIDQEAIGLDSWVKWNRERDKSLESLKDDLKDERIKDIKE